MTNTGIFMEAAMRTNFEQLQVYQIAEQLADDIWQITAGWERFARQTVGQQLVRSSDSIGANIAEGTGRGSLKDRRRFVLMARGSLYETRHWLRRAYKRKLLSAEQIERLKSLIDNLSRLLNGYLRSMNYLQSPGQPGTGAPLHDSSHNQALRSRN